MNPESEKSNSFILKLRQEAKPKDAPKALTLALRNEILATRPAKSKHCGYAILPLLATAAAVFLLAGKFAMSQRDKTSINDIHANNTFELNKSQLLNLRYLGIKDGRGVLLVTPSTDKEGPIQISEGAELCRHRVTKVAPEYIEFENETLERVALFLRSSQTN